MTTASTPTSTGPNVAALTSALWQAKAEYIMFRIGKKVAQLTPQLTAKGRAPLKLSIGAPTLPPPQALVEAFKGYLDEPGIDVYSVPRGEPFFREAVASRLQRRFGVTVNPNTQVCSLIGSKEGLANMFRAIITPSLNPKEQDIIIIPDPGYASYVDSIAGAGGLPYAMPLTAQNNYLPNPQSVLNQLIADGYKAEKVKAIILNYPSNPLGATAPLSYYEEMVAFARKHNILIISDNAYCDLYFSRAEKPHSILEVPGAIDIAIEFHSLSKPYCLTGWRLGFAVGNQTAIDLLATVKSTMDSGLFRAIQKAGVFALTEPAADAHIEAVNAVYEHNQGVFVAGLKRLGWPVNQLLIPDATFYFWLPIPPRYKSCEQFADELLEKSGIVTVPGTGFGQHGEGFVRLSLVLPEAELNEVIDRMQTDGFVWHN